MAGLESWVEILPDFSKLDGKVKSHLTSTLGDAGSASAGSFGSSFKSSVGTIFTGNFLADIAGQAARGIGQMIGSGIRSGIDYSLGSIDLASDLNESLNASKVTFGKDVAAQLEQLGKDAPQRLALTRNAFAAMTVQFGAFAKSIRGNDVVGFLDELTTRGADFASVYNLDVKDALALFQSGLAGETEPLRKFGIDLSAASVEAYAHANGIGEVGRELTEAEKVQARYGALLSQTAQVQGDNANTADEYAGALRRLNVKLEEAQTNFGQALLPTAIDVVTFANDDLLPILTEALAKVGPVLSDSLAEQMPKIKELIGTAAESLPGALEVGIDAASSFADLFDQEKGIPGIVTNVQAAIEAFEQWRASTTVYVELTDAGLQWMDAATHAAWVVEQANQEASAKTKAHWLASIDETVRELDQKGKDWVGVGEHYGDGLAEGLRSRVSTVRDAAAQLAGEAIFTTRSVGGVKSPSRVMREVGGYYGQGFVLGIRDQLSSVAGVSSLMASTVTGIRPADISTTADSGVVSAAGGGVRDVHFHTEDPMVAYQMMQNEIGTGLAVLRK